MDASGMFLNAIVYVALIILSGISLLAFFIVFIIKLSQDSKNKWNWLIGVIVSLIALSISIYLFTRKIVSTVKNIGEVVEEKIEKTFDNLEKSDSTYKYGALESNSTVIKLKEFEKMNEYENVPKEFYVYYGFRDYYRMPLTYPYAFHCIDILESASLYNEELVINFNENDNGEQSCGIDNITEFAFDQNALIAKVNFNSKKSKSHYTVYEFETAKTANFNLLKDALSFARRNYNYRGYDTLITVMDYNHLFY